MEIIKSLLQFEKTFIIHLIFFSHLCLRMVTRQVFFGKGVFSGREFFMIVPTSVYPWYITRLYRTLMYLILFESGPQSPIQLRDIQRIYQGGDNHEGFSPAKYTLTLIFSVVKRVLMWNVLKLNYIFCN